MSRSSLASGGAVRRSGAATAVDVISNLPLVGRLEAQCPWSRQSNHARGVVRTAPAGSSSSARRSIYFRTHLAAKGAVMSRGELGLAANTVWVVLTAVLVMLMQGGFALLEAGVTRAKNAAHVTLKNLLSFAVCSVVYWGVGFALAFGDGGKVIGWHGFFPGMDELMDVGTAPFTAIASVPGAAGYLF